MPTQVATHISLTWLRRSLFLVSMPIFFINFSLPVQAKALGANATEIGWLIGLFSFTLLFMRPLVGFGMDRFGRRPFFLGALFLYAFTYAGYGFAQGLEAMYTGRILQGFAAAMLLVAVDTITADLTDSTSLGTEMGKNIQAQTRSTFVGAFIGFGLVGMVPLLAWSYSFTLFSVFACLGLLFALVKLPESASGVGPVSESALTANIIDRSVQAIDQGSDQLTMLAEKSKVFRKFLMVLMPIGFCGSMIQPMYLVYLQDQFTSDMRLLSWAFLPAGILFAILPAKMGRFVDRGDTIAYLGFALGLAGLTCMLIPNFTTFWSVVLVYSVSVVPWTLVDPARKVLVSTFGECNEVAKSFGISEMYYGIGATTGPIVGGYLYDWVSPQSPFYFNGILSMLVALSIVLLFSKERSR